MAQNRKLQVCLRGLYSLFWNPGVPSAASTHLSDWVEIWQIYSANWTHRICLCMSRIPAFKPEWHLGLLSGESRAVEQWLCTDLCFPLVDNFLLRDNVDRDPVISCRTKISVTTQGKLLEVSTDRGLQMKFETSTKTDLGVFVEEHPNLGHKML